MNMHKILFLPHNKEIFVKDGESIIRAALNAGVHINASCGGEGVCGKCRIIIEKGEVEGGISEKLKKKDIDEGIRQACTSIIKSDIIVRIPIESTIDASVLNMPATPRKTASIVQMDFEELKEKDLFAPPVEKIYIELPEPSVKENLSDVTRIINFLRQHNNEHRLEVDISVIRKIPDIIRENNFNVTVTIARPVRDEGKNRLINIQSGDRSNKNYAIAIDIGTTTVYGQLIDLITGKVLSQHAEFNSQISYGEDVISRIMFAEKEGGLKKMHDVVIGIINKIIEKILKEGEIDVDDISTITIAGNTTMTQLFLMVNPKYIRRAPYVPAANIYPPIKAVNLDIKLADHSIALVFPLISSYVGGDIVSGVMGSGMYRSEEVTLFMDIGTNAEIVIGNKDWMVCAACSAGPAFEGGGIQHGMRATKGAIEDFSIDPISLEPMIITIGNQRAKGICGSGLITIIATFFELGIINNSGKFNIDLNTPRIRESEGVYEYVLSWAKETQIDRDITISEIDIENLIRAKGSIYSGCMTMLKEVGLGIENLDRIILAGGFGSYIDLEKAMTIGLIPEINPDKVTYIGNGSLLGAKMSSITNRIRKDVAYVTKMMTNFELSETTSYMDNYIAALFLPHTDLNLFPKLKKRLNSRKT
ncbi:MAG: DUF4445 domain-containing protein [Desulfobacterales bacterium]|nr:DUF4445 domain-containing protein [Desulfobacterales bacterium]